MKNLTVHPLIRYVTTYHLLSFILVFLVVGLDGVSGRTDIKTKNLVLNIRTHLVPKTPEIVEPKICEPGSRLCKNLRSSRPEPSPSLKTVGGQKQPFHKVSPKDTTPITTAKDYKKFPKAQKEKEVETQKKLDKPKVKKEELSFSMSKKISMISKSLKASVNNKEKPAVQPPVQPLKDVKAEIKNKPKIVKKVEEKVTKEKTDSIKVSKSFLEKQKETKVQKPLKEGDAEAKKSVKKTIKEIPIPEIKKPVKMTPKEVPIPEIKKPVKVTVKEIPVPESRKTVKMTAKGLPAAEAKNSVKMKLKEIPAIEAKKTTAIKRKEIFKEMENKRKYAKTEKNFKSVKSTEKRKDKDDNLFFLGEPLFLSSLGLEELKNELCKKHSHIYIKQLKKHKIWALMMYDATAKLPSGILSGNINQYGDFDECLSINAVFKKPSNKHKPDSMEPPGIRGKYCLANIDISAVSNDTAQSQTVERIKSFSFIRSTIHDPGHFIPRFSSVNWGVCAPSTCPAEDVEKYIESHLETYNQTSGLLFNVKVEEENCVVKEKFNVTLGNAVILVIFFYIIVTGMAIYATYIDFQTEKCQKETSEIFSVIEDTKEVLQISESSTQDKPQNFIMAFSFKRNLKKLFSDNDADCIQCISGIKSVFTIMLYFAHKTIPLGWTPFTNRIFFTKISNEASTVILRTSIIYTDSFLLISGVLTSYNLAKEIFEKGKISWAEKLTGRFIRLTPALFAVVLFYAYIWDHLGSGPLWNLVVKKNSELCQNYMWRNILYIQNFFAFEKMCAPQTHQLALDMQLSLLAPLFVHILYTYDKLGVGILQAFFLLSSIMRYISTANNNLSVVIYHGVPVSQLYNTANLLYTQTLHRASPYLMGSIVGYYLKKCKRQQNVPKAVAVVGWIVAFSLGYYCLVSPSHLAHRDYQYNVHEAAQYAALTPVAWSFALSWLIVACHLGYGGKLNEFLSNKSLLVFSRISYSIYLTQFLIFFYKIGVRRIPEMFTFSGSFNISELFTVVVISFVITLLFDIPMTEIKRITINKLFKKSKVLPVGSHDSERRESEKPKGDTKTDEENISQKPEYKSNSIDYSEEVEEENRKNIEEDVAGSNDQEEDEENVEYDNENEQDYNEEDEENIEQYDQDNEQDDNEEDNDQDGDEINEEEDNEEDVDVETDFQLRRSTRIHFDEEPEDKDWLKVQSEPDETDEKN